MSFEIKNKNVLITGATSGIGEATAIDLAKKGANIFFIARNNLKAQNLSDKIELISGKRPKFFIADLASLKNIKESALEFISLDIPLHVLLNNAGLINNCLLYTSPSPRD